MKIYLIRHGETEFNRDFRHLVGGRSENTLLTELGKQQAIEAGQKAGQKCKITATKIYSSPIIRSVETAKLFLGHSDFEICEALMEQTHGDWEGKPRAEIYDFEVRNKINGGWYGGGESFQEAKIRIGSWFVSELKNWSEDEIVFVFAHGIILNILAQFVLGFDTNNTSKLKMENLEYHFFEYSQNQLTTWKLSQQFL